jgi:hypothetical protein
MRQNCLLPSSAMIKRDIERCQDIMKSLLSLPRQSKWRVLPASPRRRSWSPCKRRPGRPRCRTDLPVRHHSYHEMSTWKLITATGLIPSRSQAPAILHSGLILRKEDARRRAAASLRRASSDRLERLLLDNLDAAVLGAAFLGTVVGDGLFLTPADGAQP